MNYKTNHKNLLAVLIATIFFISQLILCVPIFSQKIITSQASSTELKDYQETIEITNGNFASTSSSSYPRTPSNWELQEGNTSKDNAFSGIIDISTSNFEKNKEDYKLTTNPEAPTNSDDYILMLNSRENIANYGYKSATINLDAQSYYSISFQALTQSVNNNGFSAYIVGDKIENTALNSFVNVQCPNWTTFTFYIATGLESTTVNIELWIGTKNKSHNTIGSVFFDNVKAVKYSETAYSKLPNDALTTKTIDLQSQLVNKITNASFENSSEIYSITANSYDKTLSGITSLSQNGFDTINTDITTAPSTNMLNARNNDLDIIANQKGLFINNKVETMTGYKTSTFVIDRFETYAISIWVKTGNLSENGATLILTEVDDNTKEDENEENTLYSSKFETINTTSYENKFTNNWAQYTFYVQGNPYEAVELELQMWLGTEGAETRGYAFFDEIRVNKITTSQYTNATEGTYIKKLSLSNLESLDIANGAFNLITSGDKVEGVYEPSDWTLTSESKIDSKYSGIINTKTEYFDKYSKNYNLFVNPGVIPSENNNLDESQVSNNILMIYNPILGDQTYTSSEYSLSADTTYKITFYAKVAENTNYAVVNIMNNSNTIAKYVIKNTEWQQYTLYVKNGSISNTLTIALSLGTTETPITGHAFFDNFLSQTLEEGEEDIYSITTNETTYACDLSEENFLVTGDKVNDVYNPYLWEGKNNSYEDDSIVAGILDKDNNTLPFDISNEDAKTPNSLVIFSPNDTYYTFTSKNNYTFNASSYYTITFTYKTFNLSQDEENKVLDDDKAIPYGVFFNINGLNVKSNAIISTDNKFVTYTMYIKTSSSENTSTISIELGGSNALTKGGIAVSSIVVSESTLEAYNEINDIDANVGMKVDLSNGDSNEEDTDDNSGSSTPNFQLIDIAGIIIVVAIVIAIIGTIIKQVMNRKKQVKTGLSKYDRKFGDKNIKGNDKIELRLQEVETELTRLNEVIKVLNDTQNKLISQRDNTTNSIEVEKLNKQIEKISKELSYELDNRESVIKEKNVLKNMLDN